MLGGFMCNSGRIDQNFQNEVPAYLHVYQGGGGGTLGIYGWGCAAGTLEPLTKTKVI